MPHTFFKRLPPELREAVLEHLREQSGSQLVSVAQVVHLLSEKGVTVELSEKALKSSIAEAAIKKGFSVAFDGT